MTAKKRGVAPCIETIPADSLVDLYRRILVRWETTLKGQSTGWNIRRSKKAFEELGVSVVSTTGQLFKYNLDVNKRKTKSNYIVFCDSEGSQARSLFYHLRNSLAHAGVTYAKRAGGLGELHFIAKNTSRVVMCGRLLCNDLSRVIDVLELATPSSG